MNSTRLKNLLAGIAVLILVFLTFRYCEFKNDDSSHTTIEETDLIQQEIRNVGKLVVTEGHFSEVITYKDRKPGFMDMVSFEKKALVVVNAEASVSYDLRQIQYDVDPAGKTITVKNIPKEEIKITPDIKFYDVEQSTFNEFTGEDYNKINKQVKATMRKKIEASTLKTNAQNRLLSELSKILILTNSMGWTLQYNGEMVNDKNLDVML